MMRQMPGHLCNETSGKKIIIIIPCWKQRTQSRSQQKQRKWNKQKKMIAKNKNTGKIPEWYHYQTKIDLAK